MAIGQKQEFKNRDKLKNVFFAGDYKLGATTLINAIGDAKKVAYEIDKFLMKRDLSREEFIRKNNTQTKRSLNLNYIPLTEMRLRDISQRTFKAEVELGFSKSESKKNHQDVICVITNLKSIMIYVSCVMNVFLLNLLMDVLKKYHRNQ